MKSKIEILQLPFEIMKNHIMELTLGTINDDYIPSMLNEYKTIYKFENDFEVDNINHNLEEIFRIFNIEHPEDFKGHSLSVNDIVKFDDIYFLCSGSGWKNITKLFREAN